MIAAMRGIATTARLLHRTWRDVLDFAFPTACAACGTALEAGAPLCESCDSRLHDLRRLPSCVKCASPLPDLNGPCGRCRGRGIRPLRAIGRLSTFESTTRDLVHAIKYGRRWPIVDLLAAMLREQPRVASILAGADVVVPIPLHWTRRFTRGFNQAELLAAALARPHRLRVANVLRRSRRTPSQTSFHSRRARVKNVARAFDLRRPALVTGKHVVLIDDVMTSGATIRAAAGVIRRGAKPASISAIVIATANPLRSELVAI